MTRLSLALLGPMQVQLDGKLITLAYDKVRALLAYLALESTRPLRRDTLTALLWPQQPDKEARHNLSQALLKCRQAIDRDGTLLLTNRHTVQLNPEMEIELDTAEFETQLRHCQTHPHVRPEICADCMHCRETAVVLYQGDFLSGLSIPDSPAFDDWLVVWRERLRQQAMAALDALAHYHERRGELEPALKYARRQVTFEPWREEAQRQLMRLLLYSGQRSAALAQYKTCAHILAHELDVAPSAETQTLYEQIKTAAPHPPHNLPSQPTPFIGRQEELAHIASLLADPDCRLLTLVGPGGMGKTRLALAAAERQLRRPSDSLLPDSSTYSFFTHGVYFVSLAAVSTAASIVSAIADAIGLQLKIEHKPQKSLSSKDQLLAHLAEQRALLILDNYETFLESSTRDASIQLIIDILQAAPTVKLLVTSRQKLLLKEAFVFALDGLRFPQVDERRPLPTTAVVEYAALTLLVQCARQVQPQFSYDEEQLTQLAHICELLMGMPLAVEMAGTAAAAMPPATLASAISKSLDVLQAPWQNVPPRHRSVRAAFASSWQQLSEVERVAFANLSIFSGGFTQKAAQE
ncbi:MAG: AAA family ATPase, partial [Chloroflexi bacterium]|nr:AAA family ATPase [Chloroflexota bacterium]